MSHSIGLADPCRCGKMFFSSEIRLWSTTPSLIYSCWFPVCVLDVGVWRWKWVCIWTDSSLVGEGVFSGVDANQQCVGMSLCSRAVYLISCCIHAVSVVTLGFDIVFSSVVLTAYWTQIFFFSKLNSSFPHHPGSFESECFAWWISARTGSPAVLPEQFAIIEMNTVSEHPAKNITRWEWKPRIRHFSNPMHRLLTIGPEKKRICHIKRPQRSAISSELKVLLSLFNIERMRGS